MGKTFRFWWLCVRRAFWGNAGAANDWQWVFANPLWQSIGGAVGAALGAFASPYWRGAPMMSPDTPIGVFLGGLFGFAFTWLIFFIVRFLRTPARLYYEQKERADKLEADGARQRLLEWKDVPEAIEAFAESSLLKARDKWKAQLEEVCGKAPDAEDQIRNIRKKFANGHVPDDTPEAGSLATARGRLVALAMSHDLAKDELRRAWDGLRSDIHRKLSGGGLIAKGFPVPHVAGIAEIEIPAEAWRILLLDETKSEAIRKDVGGSIYAGLMIAKCPILQPEDNPLLRGRT